MVEPAASLLFESKVVVSFDDSGNAPDALAAAREEEEEEEEEE
jgi:hypothetical protein